MILCYLLIMKSYQVTTPPPQSARERARLIDKIQEESSSTYSVWRFFKDQTPRQLIKDQLTLSEKDAYFEDEVTAGEGWFDGFYKD